MCACDLGGLLGSDGPRVGAELIDVRQLSQPRYWSLVCDRKLCRLATEIVFCVRVVARLKWYMLTLEYRNCS